VRRRENRDVPEAAAPTLLVEQHEGSLPSPSTGSDRGNALDGPTVDALIAVLEASPPSRGERGRCCCAAKAVTSAPAPARNRWRAERGERGTDRAHGGAARRPGSSPDWSSCVGLFGPRAERASPSVGPRPGHVGLTADVTVGPVETPRFADRIADGALRQRRLLLRPGSVRTRLRHGCSTRRRSSTPTRPRRGLVSEVVPGCVGRDRRPPAAAERLARQPRSPLGVTKELVHRHLRAELGSALPSRGRGIELTIRSDDFKEGIRAFGENAASELTGH